MEKQKQLIEKLKELNEKQEAYIRFLKTKPNKDNPAFPAYDTIINGMNRGITALTEILQSTPAIAEGKELPSDEEMKDACAEYFLYKPKEHNNTLVAFREGAKWMRSQLQSLPKEPIPLRDELIKFAQQFYADEETCIHNVDSYLNKP